jgi:hypothetical protein
MTGRDRILRPHPNRTAVNASRPMYPQSVARPRCRRKVGLGSLASAASTILSVREPIQDHN